MSDAYTSQILDHLGIVAGVCQQIGLMAQIDARVADTGRKVSVGQAVQAMVLNGLGFVGRPLYLSPEFFRNKPVDLLIGEGLEADDLNEDSLGRALDHLYAHGVTELFAAVCAHALRVYGIGVRFAHLDTTAFSLEGQYLVEEADEGDDLQPIRIAYGYSKDRRPDLKQAVMGLICVNDTAIPAYLTALSGNVSDKTSMPDMATLYLDQFGADDEMPVLVADSALYGADNLQRLSDVLWVTRVPITLSEAKTLVAQTTQAMMQASEREGYFYHEVESSYGGIEQRWLVVLYEPRREQEQAQLHRQIERERTQVTKALKKLHRMVFNCAADAQTALHDFARQWSFHGVTGEVGAVIRYTQPGRPKADSSTTTDWKITAQVEPDEAAIQQQQQLLGKYLIATNELDRDKLPAEVLLTVYKDQNRSVERGFRFLKDPLFFASRFFLKKPSRIMGLLMVMGLSLLIYALAEHDLRQKLRQQNQSVPDQKGTSTQRPTMRRVFQMFEGIHILLVETGQTRQRRVLNVQDVHIQIATLLGQPILKFYVLTE